MAGNLGDLGETFVRARLDTRPLEAGWAVALSRTRTATAQIETAMNRQGRVIEAGFGRITQAGLGAQRGLVAVGSGLDRAGLAAGRFGVRLLSLRSIIGVTIAGAAVKGLFNYAAAWENAGLRIRTVSKDSEQAIGIQNQLFQLAQETGTEFTALAETYQRVSFATAGMNLGVEGTIGILSTLSKIAAISGTTVQEATNALRQLTQAFASGGLRGDELRSVSEQLPGVLRAIAEATGKTTGEIIAFGRQHGIATETVIEALERYEQTADEAFNTVGDSLSRAATRVSNSFLRMIGDTAEASGLVDELKINLKDFAGFISSPEFAGAIEGAFEGLIEVIRRTKHEIDLIRSAIQGIGEFASGLSDIWSGETPFDLPEEVLVNLRKAGLTMFELGEIIEEDERRMRSLLAVFAEPFGPPKPPPTAPPPPLELKAAPSGRGGGAGGLSEGEKAAERMASAIKRTQLEMAELIANTETEKNALDALKASGLPFDTAERKKILDANEGLRAQWGELIKITNAANKAKQAKSFADDMADATENAKFAMADLAVQTIKGQAALEAIKAAGLPFDATERENILNSNAALRENFNELTRVTEARLRLAQTQPIMEKAAEVIPERRQDVFEQQRELLAPGLGPSLQEIQGQARAEAGQQLGLPAIEAEREAILASNDALRQKFDILTQLNAQSAQIELQSELWQQQAQVLTEISGIFSDLATTAIFEGPQEAGEQFLKLLVEMAIQAAFIMAIFGAAGLAGFGPGVLGAGGGLSQLPIFGALFGGGRQHGGSVRAGQDYLVGEAGPELFRPATSGTVINNRDLTEMGSSPFIGGVQIDARGAQAGVGAEIVRALDAFEKRLPGVLAESDRRGLSGRKR